MGRSLAPVRGDQHSLEDFELLQALARADGHAGQRVLRHVDRHPCLVLQALVNPLEQSTAAGEHDSLVHEVGGQLGMASAVRSPSATEYSFLTCWMMASSSSSPPTRIDVDVTTPPNEMTATSVVPPPMSTTMFPEGSWIGRPAPMAAAMGSSMMKAALAPAEIVASSTARCSTPVIPDGTHTTTRGLAMNRLWCTFWMK